MFLGWTTGSLKKQAITQELNLREAQRECLIAERRLGIAAEAELRAARTALSRGDLDTSKEHVAASVELKHSQRRVMKQRMQIRRLSLEVMSISMEPHMKQNIMSGVTALLAQANKKIKSKSALASQQRAVSKELGKLRDTNKAMDEMLGCALEDDDDVLSGDEEEKEVQQIMTQLQDEAAMESTSLMPHAPIMAAAAANLTTPLDVVTVATSSLKDEEK